MPMRNFTPQTKRRLMQGIVSGLSGLVIASILLASGFLDLFEPRTFDWRVRLMAKPGPASNDIRLVLLDQQSLDWASRENGLSWPWPREVYGAVIDFCRRAGAKSLAFDVLLTEHSKYGVNDDRSMGEAARKFGKLVLPVFLGQSTGNSDAWPDYAKDPDFKLDTFKPGTDRASLPIPATFPRASFPVPELAASAAILGNVHQEPDPDGVYRRIGLFAFFQKRAVPSLALASYLLSEPAAKAELGPNELRLNNKSIPLDKEGLAILNFRGPSGTYKSYSAAAVIQSELKLQEGGEPSIDPAEFKDKYVFFGFTAPGLFDLKPTPVSGVYSGAEICAQGLDNLLSQDFLREPPGWAVFLLSLFLAMIAALLSSVGASTGKSLLSALLCLPLPVGISFAGYALGYVLPMLLLESSAAGALSVSVLWSYATEGRQRRFIKNAFRQYLSPTVIEELIQNPDKMKLGGERRVLSIFFSDLQGFTSISESLSSEELTNLLNEYLTAMTDIIMEEGGTVDKFEGDAIIAFWNAPLDHPDHASRALRASLRCQDRLAEMRPYFRRKVGKELLMRVGLNTGPAVVGNMGSHARFDYTMLGDSVNLASRLEGVNKMFGTYTLVSKSVLEAARGEFAARELGRVKVVGRNEPVVVFEPMWPDDYSAKKETLEEFGRALQFYYDGDFAHALKIYEGLAHIDAPSASYVPRCREMLDNARQQNWAGVCVMTTK